MRTGLGMSGRVEASPRRIVRVRECAAGTVTAESIRMAGTVFSMGGAGWDEGADFESRGDEGAGRFLSRSFCTEQEGGR